MKIFNLFGLFALLYNFLNLYFTDYTFSDLYMYESYISAIISSIDLLMI